MTLAEQFHVWQQELQELRQEIGAVSAPGLEQDMLQWTEALSSARALVDRPAMDTAHVRRDHQSERRIDFIHRGYIETNHCGIIKRTNNASAMLLNFPRHLLAGQPLLVFISKAERKSFLTAFMELRRVTEPRRADFLVSMQPAALDPYLALMIGERIDDADHTVMGITWLFAPA